MPEELILENPEKMLWSLLSDERVQHAIGIRDDMLGRGRDNPDPDQTLTELWGKRLVAGGLLDRCLAGIQHRLLPSPNSRTTQKLRYATLLRHVDRAPKRQFLPTERNDFPTATTSSTECNKHQL